MTDKRAQVVAQCKAVVHLAQVIAEVHADFVKIAAHPSYSDDMIEFKGQRTAHLMELLGEIVNGMDAVQEEDKWLDPIYKEAHRLWPPEGPRSASSPRRKRDE